MRALTRYIVHCVWFATLCFAFVWEYSVCATHFKSCQSLHELAGLLCEFVMLCLNNFLYFEWNYSFANPMKDVIISSDMYLLNSVGYMFLFFLYCTDKPLQYCYYVTYTQLLQVSMQTFLTIM